MRSLSRLGIAMLGLALVGCGATQSSPVAPAHATHAAAIESPSETAGASLDDGPPADATRLDDGTTIVMSQFEFSETAVIVPAGATLTFSNEDNVHHTVTHGVQGFPVDEPAFDEPVMDGDSVEITFDEPGRYDITCIPHPIMQMTVFVEG